MLCLQENNAICQNRNQHETNLLKVFAITAAKFLGVSPYLELGEKGQQNIIMIWKIAVLHKYGDIRTADVCVDMV